MFIIDCPTLANGFVIKLFFLIACLWQMSRQYDLKDRVMRPIKYVTSAGKTLISSIRESKYHIPPGIVAILFKRLNFNDMRW